MYTYVLRATIFTPINRDATLTPAPQEQVEKGERRPAHTIVHLANLYEQTIRLSTPAPYSSLSKYPSPHPYSISRINNRNNFAFPLILKNPLYCLSYYIFISIFQIPYHTPDSNADLKSFITFDSRRREVMRLCTCHVGVMNFSGNISFQTSVPTIQFASELHHSTSEAKALAVSGS
jgi:hypothetical protein